MPEGMSGARVGAEVHSAAVDSPASVRLVHLDLLRGMAALAVVVGHIRGFVLTDYGISVSKTPWQIPMYVAGSLGHQSVIAFFALSGFLVGGKALRDMMSGKWALGMYISARLARLWTVAVPALFFTLIIDFIGIAFGFADGYRGALYSTLSSGPSVSGPADHSVATFLANVAFLQTIISPVYGSNGPLWSLANEFWYYIIFPLLTSVVLVDAATWRRITAAIVSIALAWWLPFELLALGLIWCAGAGTSLLTRGRGRCIVATPFYGAAAAFFVTALISVSSIWRGMAIDLTLGLAWAAMLPALAVLPQVGGLYACIARWLSEISYTLYATHFPLLAAIYFIGFAPAQWAPGLGAIGAGSIMLAATLLQATALWWCFERNTQHVMWAIRQVAAVGRRAQAA